MIAVSHFHAENEAQQLSNQRADSVESMNSNVDKQDVRWLPSLQVFCNDVSVVGLRHVVNRSTSVCRRSVWLLLIVVGAAMTTYHIQDRIRLYFRYPVNVNLYERRVKSMRFPTVTVCNENRLSLSKFTSMGKKRLSSRDFCCYLTGFLVSVVKLA